MKHQDALKKWLAIYCDWTEGKRGVPAFCWAKEFELFPIGSTLRKISLVEANIMAWSSARLKALFVLLNKLKDCYNYLCKTCEVLELSRSIG